MQTRATASGVLSVDLDALARNYRRLCARVAPAESGAVVKANAYGLGVAPVARRLAREGCRRFFVATAAEGLELRALLPEVTVYLFEGASERAVAACVEAELTPVLNSIEQVERWAGTGRAAVLHVDTGMARLGMSEAEVCALARRPGLLERLDVELVMTHLACADEPGHALNAEQLRRFEAMRRHLPAAPTSIGNSACAFLGPEYCGSVLRPGIALYGGNPSPAEPNPVEPVATLEARVLQLRDIDRAQTVGYGATHDAFPPARLATVGIGYADGYPRCLGGRAAASVGGRRAPVVGRVSMDTLCLDVSDLPPDAVRVGQLVELLGPNVPLEEIADAAGTINYEILTRFGTRLQRRYSGGV